MMTYRERPMTMLCRGLVLVALGAVCTQAATPEPPKIPVESYRLPNGLKVALSRDPSVPRVTVCLVYHVGSKNERAGRTGFAHFFEHMMFRGTKNVPNYDIPLQEAGSSSNATTSEDLTTYFETVPSNYLERALYLEAERMAFLASALDQEKFDTEREVVKNERRMRVDNQPYGISEEAILAHLYPKGHPYSWSVIGSMKDLDRASLKDLRRFFGEFYHPGNAALCLVGDFDPAQAKKWIETYFAPIKRGPDVPTVKVPAAPAVEERVTLVDRVQLPRVIWAWPSVGQDDPDDAALHLLGMVLASGDASRLHKALVLTQIASDVSASNHTMESSGLFEIEATAAPEHTLGEIERVLAEQVGKLQGAPPDSSELRRVQALTEKQFYSSFTSPLGRAMVIAFGLAQEDDPLYYRKEFARIFQVTTDDIQRVAKKYLVSKKLAIEINPAKKGETKSVAPEAGPLAETASGADSAPIEREVAKGPDWSKLPGPVEPGAFHPPAIVRKKLSNGVDLWAVRWTTLPIVSVRLLLPAGTADDPSGKSGLATLTARLLDKGTKDLTATELAEAFEALGTAASVHASNDTTSVSLSVVKRNLPAVLGLVGKMLESPRFAQDDFSREQQLLLSDLLQGPDDPSWIARRAFRAILFGQSHPYGNPPDGSAETVKKLTLEDIKNFSKEHFAANRATLIIVGDFETEALEKTLESALGSWKTTGPAPAQRPAPAVKPDPGVVFLVDKPGAVQSVLDVGGHWVDRRDPRYFATLIGNRILGADFLSRLMQNLREQHGYTYGVRSVFDYRRTDSVWLVNSAVRADVTAEALKEIVGELNALRGARPFTGEEVEIARTGEARAFPETFESPGGIAGLLEEMAEFALPNDYLETFLDRLNATTTDQVQKTMAEVIDPAKRTMLVVGDREETETKLKAQGFRDVRVVTPDGKAPEKP